MSTAIQTIACVYFIIFGQRKQDREESGQSSQDLEVIKKRR